MLHLEGNFTPTLFIGYDDLSKLSGGYDSIVAHELGHALGLPHVDEPGNLMVQGGLRECRRWLSQSQINSMGPFADDTLVADTSASEPLGTVPEGVVPDVDATLPFAQVALTPADAHAQIVTGRSNVIKRLMPRQRTTDSPGE